MLKALSLKMDPEIFAEAEKMVKNLHIPRNAFINKAVAHYIRFLKRQVLKRDFKRAALLAKQNPDPLIKELDQIDDLFE